MGDVDAANVIFYKRDIGVARNATYGTADYCDVVKLAPIEQDHRNDLIPHSGLGR